MVQFTDLHLNRPEEDAETQQVRDVNVDNRTGFVAAMCQSGTRPGSPGRGGAL